MRIYIIYILLIICCCGACNSYSQQVGMQPLVMASSSAPFTPPTPDFEYINTGTMTVLAGLVSQWNDNSGHGRHLTATLGARPTVSGSGVSTIVTFNGVSNFMSASFSMSASVTIYIIVKPKNFAAFAKIFFDGIGFGSMALLDDVTSPDITLYTGSALGAANSNATLNVTKMITSVFNSSASSISVNDGTKTTNPTTAIGSVAGAGGFTLGAGGGGSSFLNCDVVYVGGYFSAHSSALQTQIYNYWKAIYGL